MDGAQVNIASASNPLDTPAESVVKVVTAYGPVAMTFGGGVRRPLNAPREGEKIGRMPL